MAIPRAVAFIPAETESEHTCTEVYRAAYSATNRIPTLPSCGRQECKPCTYIEDLTENRDQVVAAMLRGTQHTTLNQLPIENRLSKLLLESLEGACARLQYSCICYSGQQRDVQEAIQNSRSV